MKDVGHVVWFVKHLRYCGSNKEKANEILGPNDVDIRLTNPVQEEEKVRIILLSIIEIYFVL